MQLSNLGKKKIQAMTAFLMNCKISINKEEKYELHGEELLLLIFLNQGFIRIIQAF